MPAMKGGYSDAWRNYEYRRRPPDDETKQRQELFDSLNHYIHKNGGWLTSVPGARTVRFEVLPGSDLPEKLRALGFGVRPAGSATRILPNAIRETYIDEHRERRHRDHHGPR